MSSSSFLFRCSRLVGRVPLSSVSASPSSAAVASSSFLPNDSFLLPNSKRCWQCPSPRRRSQSYSVAAAAAVYATPQDSRHYKQHPLQSRRRGIATTIDDDDMDLEETLLPPREQMAFDVLIVGGGPAGLAAAIRIKQMCQQQGDNTDLSVCVIDKGSEIGAHILSGNVFDPKALEELFPDRAGQPDANSDHWTHALKEATGSIATPVQHDVFNILPSATSNAWSIPSVLLPSQLHNHGNYIISLSQLCRWLSQEAEALGVEIYPGFAASEVLLNNNPVPSPLVPHKTSVTGVAIRDVGMAKDGVTKKETFERGVALVARQTLFAEGARGSCSEWLMDHFRLRSGDGGKKPSATADTPPTDEKHHTGHPQQYGLGLKEVWQVPPEQFQAGLVQHSVGFPLQQGPFDKVFGGSFLYHQEPDLVLVGLVVGLDYVNPYLNPYQEFQRWKTHPSVRKHLEGGTCISYGARVLNEGGYHAIPEKLTVPGAALIGCSAGFLNAVKIKGSHTALKSGMLAAEATFAALTNDNESEPSVAETMELDTNTYAYKDIVGYTEALKDSWIYKELYEVRNSHMAFTKWGIAGGMIHTALSAYITKGAEPWTLHSEGTDSMKNGKVADFTPIEYPPADGKLTFDLLTNLQRSGTYHAEDQPGHLRIKPDLAHVPVSTSLQVYGGPEQRFCPAGVYEYVDDSSPAASTTDNDTAKDAAPGKEKTPSQKKLVINAQNCIHCKCCSIKMPKEYIEWTVPEGGGGPQYQVM